MKNMKKNCEAVVKISETVVFQCYADPNCFEDEVTKYFAHDLGRIIKCALNDPIRPADEVVNAGIGCSGYKFLDEILKAMSIELKTLLGFSFIDVMFNLVAETCSCSNNVKHTLKMLSFESHFITESTEETIDKILRKVHEARKCKTCNQYAKVTTGRLLIVVCDIGDKFDFANHLSLLNRTYLMMSSCCVHLFVMQKMMMLTYTAISGQLRKM